jgi:subtilisin-like proprotein convertase family protein
MFANRSGRANTGLCLTVFAAFLLAAVFIQPLRSVFADGPTTFSNATAINIRTAATEGTAGPASPYPSDIAVAAMAGNITKVKVTLTGVGHTTPDDIDILLQSPGGQVITLMSDAGGNSGATGITNVNLTFDDAAAGSLPDSSTITSGTYKPTDYDAALDAPFEAPAPAESGLTALSTFNGFSPNGTWHLWVRDDTSGDFGTITGGWSITITTAASAAATTTTVTSDINPSAVGNTVTFTANITSGSTVNNGTVTFTDGATTLCSNVPVASGSAQCATNALVAGNRTITATYTPGAGFLGSSGTMLQQVTSVSGSIYTNPGSIAINDFTTATPYSDNILVSGLAGTITKVTLALNSFSHTFPGDVDMLLIGPNGAQFVFMSDAGTGSTPGANLTFDDAAASLLPSSGALATGTFKPTNYNLGDTFPSTTAGTVTSDATNSAASAGTATFASKFNGASPNGVWRLYIVDDGTGETGAVSGGWSLNFTVSGAAAATTTSLTSSVNPSFTTAPNNTTTFTATVLSAGNPVTTGTVTFTDGVTNLVCSEGAQPRPLNGSGQATCTTSFATEGTHPITAAYSGTAAFAPSNGNLVQVVNNHTTVGAGNSFCNTGAVTIADSASVPTAGSPYPSNVFVSGLAGTISKVTANLKGLSHTNIADVDIMLVGPGGQRVMLVSDVGGNQATGPVNLTLDDAAAGSLPTSGGLATGTFKPTDNDAGPDPDAFPAPAPAGATGTLLSAYNATSPNGTWQVYVADDAAGEAGAIAQGWCVNFTLLAPTAANVAVSGRVTTANGFAVKGARVTMRAADGSIQMALTNSFGYYLFDNVASGQEYVVSVMSKGYRFQPQAINLTDSLTGFDFVADNP